MNRVAMVCLVLLAFGSGYYKSLQRPVPADFMPPAPAGVQHGAAKFQSDFASSRLHTQTHAASLIELKDGRIRAFWFSGSHEAAPDVEIHTSVFDPVNGKWSPEQAVASHESTSLGLHRFVRLLGNPVPGRAADGTLRLFYVTVSLGGWAGSSITELNSNDDGATWSAPRRLITSPFLNISTLVKGMPFLYTDGTMGLPEYHEFISKFGELLRLDQSGKVMDKQRLVAGGRDVIQPVVLVQGGHDALVLMRHGGPDPRRVVSVGTHDAGRHWSEPEFTSLANPDAAVTGVVLPDGRILAALNNIEQERNALSLVLSADGGATWKTVYQLEDQRNAKLDLPHFKADIPGLLQDTDREVAQAQMPEYLASTQRQSCSPAVCRFEFSYPYLIRTYNGDFHLVYTWNRSFIKHVMFNQAWLDKQLGQAK